MSMIGLLLLTGVASFSVAAEPTEQKTPVVKSQAGDSNINVKGGFLSIFRGILISVVPGESVKNNNYIAYYEIRFNDEPMLMGDNRLDDSRVSYSTGPLFSLRMADLLNSRGGTVEVTVKIRQNPGTPVQTEVYEANFHGAFVLPFKQIS